MQAIRAALGRYPSVAAPVTNRRPATLNTVTGQVAYVEHAWSSSHFTVVSQHLPRLLDDAQAVVLTTSAADQITAHRALVVAYRLASSMLLKFNANDIALGEAAHVAAQEVRCRPLAHGLLRSLLDTTSGESGRLVRQMAIRAGLPA